MTAVRRRGTPRSAIRTDPKLLPSRTSAMPLPPLSGPADHARRGAANNRDTRYGLAQARARRDLCAELADRSRQCRDQRDDGDRFHHARLALAARARRGGARIQPLSASVPARHRRRRSALADRRFEDRRRRRRGGVAPGDAPGASLRARDCARHMARALANHEHPQGDRRGARSRPGRRSLYAGIPVEPSAEPAVLRRALGLFRPRAAPPHSDRGAGGGCGQRARQLRAHLRPARNAGARGFSGRDSQPRSPRR